MRFNNKNFFLLFLCINLAFPSFSQEAPSKLREPDQLKEETGRLPSDINIKKIPNYPDPKTTAHKISASATTIPMNTRLRLSVDSFVDAKTSMIGDYFKSHILEDFYIPTEPPQLVVPKGSWVRGRISFLKKPSIFSKAAKIGLHLDQLVTPIGEVVALDAELDIQEGTVNQQGLLDPMTGFKTKALEPTQALLDSSTGTIVTIATLGAPVIGSLITGSLIALFSQGDNLVLNKGQELQILLKKDIQLTIN